MQDYKNILVINLMHIGDLMLVTPALRTLRTNFPTARITLLADKKLRDLVEQNPNLDACMLFDKKGADDGCWHLLKFIKKIRKEHFDLVINLHRNERASAIAAFSGSKYIVGYAKPGFSFFFDKVLDNYAMPGTPPEKTMHQVKAHFRVLEDAVGVKEIDDRGIEMVVPEKGETEAAKLWRENFIGKAKVIAFNIGASWMTKRWIDNYFAECADTLIGEGYEIAFFGGPGDEEPVRNCLSKMKKKDSGHIHVFTGKVSLAGLAACLRRCVLFLTTDSGPMHVGVAMHLPVVTMFGASPVPTFYPYDGRDILVKTPEKCHPCGIHECPRTGEAHMACMKHIPPKIILDAVQKLLKETGGKKAADLLADGGNFKCRMIELGEI